MTSHRAYRRASSHKRALDVLREEAGKQLDGDAVAAFLGYYRGRRTVAWSAFATAAPQRLFAWLGGVSPGVSAGVAGAAAVAIGVSTPQPALVTPAAAAATSRGRPSAPSPTPARARPRSATRPQRAGRGTAGPARGLAARRCPRRTVKPAAPRASGPQKVAAIEGRARKAAQPVQDQRAQARKPRKPPASSPPSPPRSRPPRPTPPASRTSQAGRAAEGQPQAAKPVKVALPAAQAAEREAAAEGDAPRRRRPTCRRSSAEA